MALNPQTNNQKERVEVESFDAGVYAIRVQEDTRCCV